MAYCAKCGNPLGEGRQFCASCGQPAGQAPAGAPVGAAPPPAQGPVYPAGGAYAPGPSYAPNQQPYVPGQPYGAAGWNAPPPRRGKGLVIGLVSALLVVVVACVLVFVVFKDDIFKGGAGSSPESTVSSMLKAMENRDVDALFDLMDQEALSAALGGMMSMDAAKEMIASAMFGGESVKFSGIKLSTDNTSDTTATVTITAGTVTMKDSNGVETSEDIKEASEPVTFDLIKKDGKWYLDANSLSSLGGDSSGSTDGTTLTTVGDGTDTSEVTTTETSGSVITGQSTASSPEEAVKQFLKAMESKEITAVLAIVNPATVEDALGMSLADAQQYLVGEMFDFESIKFSDIKMSTEKIDDTTATVTITEGTVTITDSSGTTTEDVRDAGSPVYFDLLKIDGHWYLDPYGLF